MKFDFSALAQIKEKIDNKEARSLGIEITKPKNNEKVEKQVVTEVVTIQDEVVTEVVTKSSNSKMSLSEKIDSWIEEYKDLPKIVYSGDNVYCSYVNDTETVTITDKVTNNEVSFVDKAFFEDVVFESNTRAERLDKINSKYIELTGYTLGKSIVKDDATNDEVVTFNDEVVTFDDASTTFDDATNDENTIADIDFDNLDF